MHRPQRPCKHGSRWCRLSWSHQAAGRSCSGTDAPRPSREHTSTAWSRPTQSRCSEPRFSQLSGLQSSSPCKGNLSSEGRFNQRRSVVHAEKKVMVVNFLCDFHQIELHGCGSENNLASSYKEINLLVQEHKRCNLVSQWNFSDNAFTKKNCNGLCFKNSFRNIYVHLQ